MIKKLLCVIMATFLMMCAYTVTPAKTNVLPDPQVQAACKSWQRSYSGAYKAKNGIYLVYTGDSGGTFFTSYSLGRGEVVMLDDYGYPLDCSYADLKWYVDTGKLITLYRSNRMVYM